MPRSPLPRSPLTTSPLARLLGLATTAYAVTTLVRPSVLTGPTEVGETPSTAVLTRAVGARDAASGLAIALAPGRRSLQLALATRAASDLGDAVAFGTADLSPEARKKILAVSLGWAALNVAALIAVGRS
ncbi:hypothetical protein GCM10009836_10680 [Pseudonocardia ailaonensis]|uniref:DUF4267 domain-containing protein n=1 Tax=Pseudonocardia ailaonensis TaxID=367279 RepID=A0ABN2MPM2_9PSEU